ncbi:carbonic anhydrase 1-like [Sycon ciliatum]|uniref:carbonic anhydrase 1-like n=1 Tax=Sycon ciliatum TaxID=27933 RepID=UPI0031F6A6C8
MEVVLLLSLCITAVSASFGLPSWSYNPDSPLGPAGWGNISGFETCGNGTDQSPINIPKASAAYMTYPALNVTSRTSNASFYFTNNGAAVRADPIGTTSVNITGGPLDSEQYSIDNFHIHFGNSTFMSSEHSVDGSRTAGELHVVFFNSRYSSLREALASGDSDAEAVISILFNVASNASSAHPGLETILRHFSTLTYPEFGDIHSIDFATLLRPSDLTSFYTYEGSQATPRCNEQVIWMVMSQVQYVLPASLNSLSSDLNPVSGLPDAAIFGGNARPLQSLNDRTIYQNFPMTPGPPTVATSTVAPQMTPGPPTVATSSASGPTIVNNETTSSASGPTIVNNENTSSASGPTIVSLVALFLSILAIYANLL